MTTALEGGEWSAGRPGRTLPPGKTHYPFYRRLGGSQGRSGRVKKLVPTGILSPDRPARSQSLYRLTYPAQNLVTWTINFITTLALSLFRFDIKPLNVSPYVPSYRVRDPRCFERITSISKLLANTTFHIYTAKSCFYTVCLNNHMFRPLYWPSSGSTLSYYKGNYVIDNIL